MSAIAAEGAPFDARYVLISPSRDEAAFMRRTLDSVTKQSVLPSLWVIVDDGSTDETPKILAEYTAKFPFIRVVRREDRGRRSVGPGVIDAFYAGLETVDLSNFGFLCKLDMDLDLPPKYFEALLERMKADPRLGTCSGKAYYIDANSGARISEGVSDEHSIGAAKFYRKECFRQIGGFVREVMWDGIDCHRCRQLGWIARSWDEPELQFIHLRPMGSSDQGILKGRRRHGFGQYYMGTGIVYVTASALFRLPRRPWVTGAVVMWWEYVRNLVTGKPRYPDVEFRRFVRSYQWSCMIRGKRRATELLEERQKPVWNPAARGLS